MTSPKPHHLHFSLLSTLTTLSTFFTLSSSLNSDGTSLLSLKYSIFNDPLSILNSWDYLDLNPCSWHGVTCNTNSRVISVILSSSQLSGSIPHDVGLIDTLTHLDLSGNFFNGTLPTTLFNASQLKTVLLSSNSISGGLPEFVNSGISSLNLSDNAIGGSLPSNFSALFSNLTTLSIKGNSFMGQIPSGFRSVQNLDLSSNLFNGSLPSDLGGSGLKFLNVSHNKLSGGIPVDFADGFMDNAVIDLSYNNLTGQIPGSRVISGQDPSLFSGNENLCGKPLTNMCVIPSTLSTPPNGTSISPAIAVIPKPVDSGSGSSDGSGAGHSSGLKPGTIVGITLADLAGVALLMAVFLYLYQLKMKKHNQNHNDPDRKTGHPDGKTGETVNKDHFLVQINITSNRVVATSHKHTSKCLSNCLRGEVTEDETTTSTQTSSESEDENEEKNNNDEKNEVKKEGNGSLIMVDGETELEVETLLKASAYILGASGSSIVYKAVLQDGTAFAVRRLGESSVERLRDFEGHVKTIAKLRHPNLVRVRGFYWGSDEKLVIYDHVSNGSLASSASKKSGSTPYHLPLLVRLKIARGVARGLAYIHDKRFVHGNIKPSNILLTPDMEPIISDLGLSWLVYGSNSCKGSGSARHFGSKRSMGSYDGTQELSVSGSPSPYINPLGNPNVVASPYQAPESLKNLKPNPKWDVYSFGIVLLELLTGKVYLDKELGQWTPSYGLEDRFWALRIADVALRAEIQGKEEAMSGVFKLGFSCASLVAQKRPSMKEALQVIEKVSLSFV